MLQSIMVPWLSKLHCNADILLDMTIWECLGSSEKHQKGPLIADPGKILVESSKYSEGRRILRSIFWRDIGNVFSRRYLQNIFLLVIYLKAQAKERCPSRRAAKQFSKTDHKKLRQLTVQYLILRLRFVLIVTKMDKFLEFCNNWMNANPAIPVPHYLG